MVNSRKDLTGQKFGKLTVIKQVEDYVSEKGRHHSQWACKCDCGNPKEIIVKGYSLVQGLTKSCGCLKIEKAKKTGHNNKKYNNYDLDTYDYGVGFTEKGEEFWFDKEDIEIIKKYCWRYDKNGYVVSKDNETKKKITLHRLVMGVTDPLIEIDHKTHQVGNAHKIDNRKNNLQIITHSDNMKNQGKYKNNTSGVTGVCWYKKYNKWMAYIDVDHKHKTLGYFNNFEDAVKARKLAEEKYFGDYRYDANN